MDNILIDWIDSFVRDRLQFVKYRNLISKPVVISSGIPGGSDCGSLLFLLFMNNIHQGIRYSSTLLFADQVEV